MIAGKILIIPVDGSRWVNMKILIQELHSRGHNITVMMPTDNWYINEESPYYTSIRIHLPSVQNIYRDNIFSSIVDKVIYTKNIGHWFSFVAMQYQMFTFLSRSHHMSCLMAATLFENQELVKRLQDAHFDLVLTDPFLGGGVLIAHYLQLPMVLNVRWVFSREAHFLLAPSPVSYTPLTGTEFTDKMTFLQRFTNVLLYGFNMCLERIFIRPHYDEVCSRYFGSDVNIYSLIQSADIWLVRVDFIFEFPRPTMPNAVYIGGFQCQPYKPLSLDLEQFMESSGEHGVIIMSLGTIITNLPKDITNKIAAAFAQLPQKVIWRYSGETPSSLGNNTLLAKWIPQNDLLGHPKTRVFVSHGGTNGIFEAIYHGVPIVGLPLLYDQFDNFIRLKDRGVAKVLDIANLNTEDVLQALKDVLDKPSYRDNMQRLSRLHHDQLIKPLDAAIFWIEYVINNKGAAHLRTESYHMPWYAYHCVDILLALLFVILFFFVFMFVLCRLLCYKVCKKRKIK
ncbi:UDP-glucuronosyltransferase 2C1-like [Erpetoichthys calabaricus]|uniref:UDP-glucuronosyltransferase 2C1-like n=1 Tax=Erpetoichthys calabaricus TaxID=27687 RepID=UPI002234D5FA|nr:UDP-glucuronosyltransferase 2C1-like [Erpetoichthys calabaricus]